MKATNRKIFGLILAGGYSRRMGRDKALLEFHGRAQIEVVLDLALKHTDRCLISKRKDQDWKINDQPYDVIDDAPEFTGHGPIGGILSAMKAYPEASWLILACDLPFITDETLFTLLNHRQHQKTATAFISTSDGLPEPLCAIWEGHAYESILKLFNEGIHCPRKALIKSDTHLISQKDPRWLDNINTPQEYASLREATRRSNLNNT